MRIAQMTGWVSFTLMTIYTSVGEVEDGMRTLAVPHALTDAPGAVTLGRLQGRDPVRGVSFAYGRERGGVDDRPDHSRRRKAGHRRGLGRGEIQPGRAAVAALRLRKGARHWSTARMCAASRRNRLRRQIGMVTQETAMFNRSARDNIAYGRPEATEAEIIAAAKAAEADEFIAGMIDHQGRKGYDAFWANAG
jgi:ATP-binding cassette subfamily B protein